MEKFVRGDVVVIPFPFSDLSSSKKRPALIIAVLSGNDYIFAQITSTARFDSYTLSLKKEDFAKGKLVHLSLIRANKLFTGDSSLISYKTGSLPKGKVEEVQETLIKILTT